MPHASLWLAAAEGCSTETGCRGSHRTGLEVKLILAMQAPGQSGSPGVAGTPVAPGAPGTPGAPGAAATASQITVINSTFLVPPTYITRCTEYGRIERA